MTTDEYHTTYSDGNTPRAGDLIEFAGKKKYLITDIDDDPPAMKLTSGAFVFDNFSLPQMRLIVRHGKT